MSFSRRQFIRSTAGLALGASAFAGCRRGIKDQGKLDLVWGRRGISAGRFQKPRAMAIDSRDRLYIVDMTARIQVFTADGDYLHGWQTPVHTNGRPTGLTVDRHDRLLVADTHYYRVLVYTLDGKLLQTIGGTKGDKPGEFGWVTDCIDDIEGNLYISQYGDWDKVQKFTHDGKFIAQWGGHGSDPGQFARPQDLLLDDEDRVWVADSCNHRIQVFNTAGKFLFTFGEQGDAPGQLYYPYDLTFDRDGNLLVCEYGNHRVQKMNRQGKCLGTWGHEGHEPGELYNPWALVYDSKGRTHVLDTNNHRVQRIFI